MLWILAFTAFGLGAQAEFFPRAFYDNFPFGRGWVAMDGRYNEHLIRDFGALNLALFVFTVGAIFVGSRAISRITAVSWLVYSVPHLEYHLRHLTMNMPGVGQGRDGGLPVGADRRRDRRCSSTGRGSRTRRSTCASRRPRRANLTQVSVRR